jgi:FixJ family two-component response regulator
MARAVDLGAAEFLQKPFSSSELLEAVEAQISGSG